MNTSRLSVTNAVHSFRSFLAGPTISYDSSRVCSYPPPTPCPVLPSPCPVLMCAMLLPGPAYAAVFGVLGLCWDPAGSAPIGLRVAAYPTQY